MKNIDSDCWKKLPFELVQHIMSYQRKKLPLKLILDIQLYPLFSKLENYLYTLGTPLCFAFLLPFIPPF